MDIRLVVSSAHEGAENELWTLYRWLAEDGYVRENARVVPGGDGPADSEMGGGALEYVTLALDAGFQMANLALAWFIWRGTRPRAPEVTFERDGVKVTLSGQDVETAARLLEALSRQEP